MWYTKIETEISRWLEHHSFYGKSSIYLYLFTLLFFLASSLSSKPIINLSTSLWYGFLGILGILAFNSIKLGALRLKLSRLSNQETICLMDILQSMYLTTLLYFFLNSSLGNSLHSLNRVAVLIITIFLLYFSYLSRKNVLFRTVIRAIYGTNVVVVKDVSGSGKRYIILSEEELSKIGYYLSYLFFIWYLLSFTISFVSERLLGLKVYLYVYLLPSLVLLFFISFLYNIYKKRILN